MTEQMRRKRGGSTEEQAPTQKPDPSTIARIAEVFYNAGLRSGLDEFWVDVCCEYLPKIYPGMAECGVYEYYLYCDEPPYSFKVYSSYKERWDRAIDVLKTMVKQGKISLGNLKVEIDDSTGPRKKSYTIIFGNNEEETIRKLDKLKNLVNPAPGTTAYISVYSKLILIFILDI